MDTESPCLGCNNAPTVPCPDCQAALYCSPDCLAADRSTHGLLCTAFASPPAKPEPGQHVLGILFPESAAAPALVWVRLDGFADEDTGISFQEAVVAPFFGGDDGPNPEALHSERNRVRNRDARSMLEAWHASKSSSASSLETNGCIRALPAGDGPFYEWKGPVLVLTMTRPTGFMVDPGRYRDITVVDFRDAVDFVTDHGNDAHKERVRAALESLVGPEVEVEDRADGEAGDGPDAGRKPEPEATASLIEMA